MTAEEQLSLKEAEYAEAMRYMRNAEETLGKSKKDDGGRHYADKKYVRTACGTAYNGILIALDAWLELKDVSRPTKKQRKSIEYYTYNIAKLDGGLKKDLNSAYSLLHLYGYYDGETYVKTIRTGFDLAYDIIERIKP
jgi:hypothetical protein